MTQSTKANLLFLKVPFSQICCSHVAIIVKVFETPINNQSQQNFTHLLAQSVINVSELFWNGLKCGFQSDFDKVDFYAAMLESPIEENYVELFIAAKGPKKRLDLTNLLSMRSRITLMSNLIDHEQRIDLDAIRIVPQVGYEQKIANTDKFSHSLIFSTFQPELPNRPYTFE